MTGPHELYAIRAMIVDDEEILARNIAAQIERCGGETFIAANGRQAISMKPEVAPDVILLDYHLPDMDGFDVMDAIHAHEPRVPCVLMTGHPTEVVLADARRHGVGRILCKPFSLRELESMLITTVDSLRGRPGGLERRQGERRTANGSPFVAMQLEDGTWLSADRRVRDRRS